MSDDELAAAADAPVALARALRGARTLVEARAIARQIGTPEAAALPTDALPTLERFAELRTGAPDRLAEADARAIVRELKAVGGDLRALRLALTGEPRGPELWTVVAALPAAEALERVRRAADSLSRPLASPGSPTRVARCLLHGRRLRSADAPAGHAERLARRATAAAGADRDLRLRADRLPAGAHRQRPALRRVHLARALAPRAWARRPPRPQHHGRQRQDLRGRTG